MRQLLFALALTLIFVLPAAATCNEKSPSQAPQLLETPSVGPCAEPNG